MEKIVWGVGDVPMESRSLCGRFVSFPLGDGEGYLMDADQEIPQQLG